jgi:hypothetical protein
MVNRFKVWSNAFYLLPFSVALYSHLLLTALLCLCVAAFGAMYHLSNEKEYAMADKVSAWLLIASNILLCYLGGFREPYFAIAFLFFCLAMFYHFFPWTKKEYSLGHGLWNLYGSLITLFCVFTFLL